MSQVRRCCQPDSCITAFLPGNSGCVECQAFGTGCCGEVRVGFSSQPVLGKRLCLRHFPEQSNRKEGRRERGLGRGKLGTLVPSPQERANTHRNLHSQTQAAMLATPRRHQIVEGVRVVIGRWASFNAAPARSRGRTARVVTGHFSGAYVAFRERHVLSACSQALSSDTILHNPFDSSQFGHASGSQSRTAFYLPRCQRTSGAKERSCPVHHLRTRPRFSEQMALAFPPPGEGTSRLRPEVIPRPGGHRRATRASRGGLEPTSR